MTDEQRVEQLLGQLLDSGGTPEEVCRAWPELLPQVRAGWQQLRAVQAEVGALFPDTACKNGAASSTSSASELPSIRGYEVQEILGRGGMGVVYKAWHLRLHRTVALKMLLAGAHARPEELERFLREAEAVAGLRHANIVQVHEIGDLDGQPYFTMEFVEGGSLAQKTAGVPQPAAEAAALLVTVAQAIQVAHRSGIAHRDLTPANILLTADGTPKISDFGLARRLKNGGGLTLTGTAMGTPSYMSPEQALGQGHALGPGVDVYALGAILYELLTGRPPFRAETGAATLQLLLTEEPVPPSRLNSRVPRDLETICLKCLHKEPSRRYASAQLLADDLRRFGAGEPIRARPAGLLERTFKWTRRRPATAALLAALLLALLGSGAAAVWYVDDWAERQQEDALHQREIQQRTQQVNREAIADLDEADLHLRAVRSKLEHPLHVAELMSDIELWQTTIALGRKAWQRAESACAANEAFVARDTRIRLHRVKADLLSEENSYRLAKELDDIRLEARLLLDAKLLVQQAGPRYVAFFARQGLDVELGDKTQLVATLEHSPLRLVLVAALDHWAEMAAADTSKVNQLKSLLELAKAADPDPWRNQFRDAAVWTDGAALKRLAAEVNVEQQSPTILSALAARLAATGDNPLRIYRQALLAHPRDFWLYFAAACYAPETAERLGLYQAMLAIRPQSTVAYNNLGVTLRQHKDFPGAIAAFQKAVQIKPHHPLAYYNLGNILQEKHDLPGAIHAFQKAVELNEKFFEAYVNLGIALWEQKDLPPAVAALTKAIAIEPQSPVAYVRLGAVLRDQKDWPGAIAVLTKAIAIDPQSATAFNNLGTILMDMNKLPEALAAYDKAIEFAPKDPLAYFNRGIALRQQHDMRGAVAAFKKVVEVDPQFSAVYIDLGIALHQQGDLPGATAAYRKSIELDPKNANAYSNLGVALRQQKDLPEAMIALKKAVELDPKNADAYTNLAVLLHMQGDLPGAIAAYGKAIEFGVKHPALFYNFGLALQKRKDWPGAVAAFKKAIAVPPKYAAAYNSAAWILATCPDDKVRDGQHAIEYATAACMLSSWKVPQFLDTLAAAYAEAGQFEKAIEYQEQALADPTYAAVASARQRLELYQNKKPFREK